MENTSETVKPLSLDLCVPLPSKRIAEIVYGTLSVDKEPKRGGVKRQMSIDDNKFLLHLESTEAKSLRVSMNSFMDHLNLIIQTIEQFGPPV